MIAIGGAIGTGLFLGSAFAIGLAGPGVLLSYAIGAVIAFLFMGCLAEMTVAHPISGSFGAYAEHYLSPLAGFLIRYAYWSGLGRGDRDHGCGRLHEVWVSGCARMAMDYRVFRRIDSNQRAARGRIRDRGVRLLDVEDRGHYPLYRVRQLRCVRAEKGSAIGFANYTSHGGFLPKGACACGSR